MPEAGFGASGAIGKGDGAEAVGMTGAAKGWGRPANALVGAAAGAGCGAGAGAAKAEGPGWAAAGGGEAGAPPELPNGVNEMVVVADFSGAAGVEAKPDAGAGAAGASTAVCAKGLA